MAPQLLYLPDGQLFTVTPVFAGVGFKSHALTTHHNAIPIGWTTVLHTEEEIEAPFDDVGGQLEETTSNERSDDRLRLPRRRVRGFVKPTLRNDTLFISSVSNPANSDFKPAVSPTRQIAMMMWVTLYWYFHQTEPSAMLHTDASKNTPDRAKPSGEWKIYIKRDGVLRGRNLIPKLERMGLIAAEDTAVGMTLDDSGEGWANMFVSQPMFWQIPGHLFLFTPQPSRSLSSFPGSPAGSRSTSPVRGDASPFYRTHSPHSSNARFDSDFSGATLPSAMMPGSSLPSGPFFSKSHLPTYYPPPPLQYTFTSGVRHPRRPKPHRMGEIFYTRFIPSVGQYLSFRVASSSSKSVPFQGPVGPKPPEHTELTMLSDDSLLRNWLANPRVSEFWGEYKPDFLENALCMRHSFPAIGMWDGVPFGYFEIYWVKEDLLGQHLANGADDWDRGLHVLVGEEWARGRVPLWMTSLVHWCLMADFRTMNICLEPRVDNAR